jgi:hypothetical protein
MYSVCEHFLASKIVRILMKAPGLEAEQIRQELARLYNQRVTKQGVYKELRRLQKSTTIFKAHGRFFLSLPWLLQSRTELEEVIATYSSLSVVGDLLPGVGESQSWSFSDIHAMDRLVVNLLVSLLRRDEGRDIYHWDPYPWYALFHADLAKPFLNEFRKGKFRAYGVLGAKSPISTRVVNAQREYGHTWWIGRPGFACREDTAISVKPPFILYIKYPRQAIQVFRDLFSHKSPFTAAAVAPFHTMLAHKLTYKVTLSHNPIKAENLAKSFRSLFID